MTYQSVIIVCWAVFLIVWTLSSLNVKRDVMGGFSGLWKQYWLLRVAVAVFLVVVAVRIGRGTAHYSSPTADIFANGVFVPPQGLGWLGALCAAAGIAFAIWARFHLGRNWSAIPAVKEQHELVTSGPYSLVRHPIYSGVLLAALGALLTGSLFGLVVFIFASIMFLLRIKKEENIMLSLFPSAYPAYRARTKRLIPFIW